MSYEEALARATSTLPGVGRGGARPSRAHELALVELAFEEVQLGDRRPQPFVALPPHLGGEAEVRGLVASSASKDAMMRADVYEWAELNRKIAADNATALRVLAEAYHKAAELLAEPADDVEERRLQTWQSTILAYTRHTFAVDLRDCPADGLRSWSVAAMAEANPVFEFVYEAAAGAHPLSVAKAPDQRSMFKGAIGDRADRNRDGTRDDDE